MDNLQIMVVRTALKKMFEEKHFSVCSLDSILKITGGSRSRPDYEMLHALHCVHYNEMPRELLREFPAMIKRIIAPDSQTISINVDKMLSNINKA